MSEAVRDEKGRWVKGVSGNPAGYPKDTFKLSKLAREYGPRCLEILIEIANDKTVPAAARVSAVAQILDRGFGRPPQRSKLEHTGPSLLIDIGSGFRVPGVGSTGEATQADDFDDLDGEELN